MEKSFVPIRLFCSGKEETLYINTFQYKPEHVDCRLCTEYAEKGQGCTAKSCPWLAERIEAGVVGYEEAIMETIPRSPRMDARLNQAIRRFSGSLFLDSGHRLRMDELKTRQGGRPHRDTHAYIAAMYLLTSNEAIYTRTAGCFSRFGIEFDRANKKEISPHDYTLLSAAKDIYTDSASLTISDLAIPEVVDTVAFSLIINAMLIARYGGAVLKINDKEGKS